MTRKILSSLVVLLALTVVGVPMSHAQDKPQAQDRGRMGKAEKIEQKKKHAQKRADGKKEQNKQKSKKIENRKLAREKMHRERIENRTTRDALQKKRREEGASKRVDEKPRMRDLRGVPADKLRKIEGRGARAIPNIQKRKALKQFDVELQKHANRLAKIERLQQISKENDNEELGKRADSLMKKESTRHTQRLTKLRRNQAAVIQKQGAKKRKQLKRRQMMRPPVETKNIDEK